MTIKPDQNDERLRDAIERGDVRAAAESLAAGASINVSMRDGSTALAYCAMLGRNELVALLLANGADPSARDASGLVPSELARRRGHAQTAVLLERATRHSGSIDTELERLTASIWGDALALRLRQLRRDSADPATPYGTPVPAGPIEAPTPTKPAPSPSLKEIKLEDLIGQQSAKNALRHIVSLTQVNAERAARGLKLQEVTRHVIFSGSPGTGKTTFARYYGQEIKKLGVLKGGHLIEVSRPQLVAEYEGQTASKTQRVVEQARGGVLFIDEAYTLKQNKDDRFGQEAIDTLLKLIEDWRDDLILVLAGYTDRMREFLQLNPGLQSRIPNWIEFDDFTDTELGLICDQMLRKAGMTIAAADRALLLEQVYRRRKGRWFGNAREVRNLFEQALAQQSARLARQDLKKFSNDELSTLVTSDVTEDPDDGAASADTTGDVKPSAAQKLDALHGLREIKQEIGDFTAYAKIQRARNVGSANQIAMTFVFSGNPGTGKTTVARLMGEILRDIGVLPTGHLVEVDRSRLVAEYQGQTAVRTREAVEDALGGILFIDEAYALAGQGREDAYGREAVDTLVKCIEDYRGQLAVVLAGYSKEMEAFLNVNPGMRSRIARVLAFPDYSDTELLTIAEDMARTDGYVLTQEARQALDASLRKSRQSAKAWGNAREARKLLEVTYRAQASRLTGNGEPTALSKEALNTISDQDVAAADRRLLAD